MRNAKRYLIRWVVTANAIAWAGSIAIHGFTGYWETDTGVMVVEFIMALGCISVWWLR